jgi:hypothetical protein
MHLLAVSGQNVAIVAIGVVAALRIAGIGRLVGEAVAIAVVLAYAMAVGWQPSVVRAAVAGVLASLAWIAARPRDRWHALAVGALVLLVWMPAPRWSPASSSRSPPWRRSSSCSRASRAFRTHTPFPEDSGTWRSSPSPAAP